MPIRQLLWAMLPICIAIPSVAKADATRILAHYVGYRIVAVKTIDKWVSSDKRTAKSEFEGCDFGRYIVFDDGSYLRCSGYGYQYAYRPEAVILANGSRIVMLVEDEEYDMTVE